MKVIAVDQAAAEVRRPRGSSRALRVLIVGLIVGAAWVVISVFFSPQTASAATATPASGSSSTTAVVAPNAEQPTLVSALGHAVGNVVKLVTPAPAAPAAAPVVHAATPVAHATAPVAAPAPAPRTAPVAAPAPTALKPVTVPIARPSASSAAPASAPAAHSSTAAVRPAPATPSHAASAPVSAASAPTGPVAANGLLGSLVTPVAGTVDSIVDAVPLVTAITGTDPVSTLTAPVVSTVDDTVSALTGGLASTDPIVTPPTTLAGAPTVSELPPAAISMTAVGTSEAATLLAAPGTPRATAGADPATAIPATTGMAATPAPTHPAPAHRPATPTAPTPQAPSPAAPTGSMTGSSSAGSGGASSTSALTADGFGRAALVSTLASRDAGIAVPASPTYDSDTTPD